MDVEGRVGARRECGVWSSGFFLANIRELTNHDLTPSTELRGVLEELSRK